MARKLKALALGLVIALGVSSCSIFSIFNKDKDKGRETTAVVQTTASKDETKPVETTTEAPAETTKTPTETTAAPAETTAAQTSQADTTTQGSQAQQSGDSMVIVENDKASFIITKVDPSDIEGYKLHVLLVNKTKDKNLMFAVDNASTNGVKNDPVFAEEVSPGQKVESEMVFFDPVVKKLGFEFSDITIKYLISDSLDYSAEPIAKGTTSIYPLGKDKAQKYQVPAATEDFILVDNKFVRVVLVDNYIDEIWGYTVQLRVENKTDKEIMVSAENAMVNDKACDPFFADAILPGHVGFVEIQWAEEVLRKSGIASFADITKVDFLLDVNDDDDLMADVLTSDEINLEATE